DRQVGGDPAAQRAADEMHATQVELIQEIEIKIGQISDSVEPCRGIRFTESRMFGSDDIEFLGKPGHAWEPNSHAAAAVEKDRRSPCPAAHEADAAVADRDG